MLDSAWAERTKLEFDEILEQLFDRDKRKRAVGTLVHSMMISVQLHKVDGFESPLLGLNACLSEEAESFRDALHEIVREKVIRSQTVQNLEFRGRYIVRELFDAISSEPSRHLSLDYRARIDASDERGPARVICDYIAGMTDSYATRMYQRLFIPDKGSIFEKL